MSSPPTAETIPDKHHLRKMAGGFSRGTRTITIRRNPKNVPRVQPKIPEPLKWSENQERFCSFTSSLPHYSLPKKQKNDLCRIFSIKIRELEKYLTFSTRIYRVLIISRDALDDPGGRQPEVLKKFVLPEYFPGKFNSSVF